MLCCSCCVDCWRSFIVSITALMAVNVPQSIPYASGACICTGFEMGKTAKYLQQSFQKRLQSDMKEWFQMFPYISFKNQMAIFCIKAKTVFNHSLSELSSITGATSHFHNKQHWAHQIICFKCHNSYFSTPSPGPALPPTLQTDLASRGTFVNMLGLEG